MTDEVVTTQQAAKMLKCSPRTIRNMILRGSLSARLFKVDPTVAKGVYLIPTKEIEKLLKSRSDQARVSSHS